MAMQMQYCKNLDLPWVCEKIHSKREAVEKRTMDITLQPRELKWIVLDSLEYHRKFIKKRTPKPDR
jgi:hypothetical protein